MENPFIENGFLSMNVSINKLFIEKMPTDKVKQDLQGKTALDIFSTKLFIEEIKRNAEELKLDLNKVEEKMLPQYLNDFLDSDDAKVKETANNIVKLFGERLGVILLTLKKGDKANRLKRKDWNDNQWDYLANLDNVILVGGLSSSKVGEKLKYYIEQVFKAENEKCYNIILNKDSSNVGIKGCAAYIKASKEKQIYLIFDCGQTFIKRSFAQIDSAGVKDIKKLDKVLSKHVDWEFKDVNEEKDEALKLHKYLLKTIIDSINEANEVNKDTKKEKDLDSVKNKLGNHIVISIANYVRNGLLADRGGYGKLRLLTNNYEEYLSNAIYEETKMKFKITLVHDGTAMAAAFSDYENSICISLGTAFGVGFPIKRE